MPQTTPLVEAHIEALQSDLDFARYELELLLKEIMIKVRAGERVPVSMARQQTALEAEIEGLVDRLN